MTLYKEKSFLHLQKRNSYLQSRENLLALHVAGSRERKDMVGAVTVVITPA